MTLTEIDLLQPTEKNVIALLGSLNVSINQIENLGIKKSENKTLIRIHLIDVSVEQNEQLNKLFNSAWKDHTMSKEMRSHIYITDWNKTKAIHQFKNDIIRDLYFSAGGAYNASFFAEKLAVSRQMFNAWTIGRNFSQINLKLLQNALLAIYQNAKSIIER